ncbi:MAG TPA: NAD-dependent epimerase/dehydratase family protein [Candidatus Kapabacteria bacterium]|nr:NAD-dependent epimerase/dehydratase family protein [Candidatus Kapabacteria bacterium]
MRCLVTGGAGFIGSHLTEYLLAEGNEVVVLDDLSSGSLENLSQVIDHPALTLVVGSVGDRSVAEQASVGCQEIYHLAACVGVKMILSDPARSMCSNVDGARTIIEVAHSTKARLFYASSSEVYGRCASGKALREDDDDCYRWSQSLRWSYASAKAFGEYLARAYAQTSGSSVVIGRLFNVAGPRQSGRYGMVIPRFIDQALSGKPITVYGTGQHRRSFTHVADTVHAIVNLTRSDKAAGEIVNIASTNAISISELAQMVKHLLNSDSEIVHLETGSVYGDDFDDAMYRVADTGKMRSLIGFMPETDIPTIIRSAALNTAINVDVLNTIVAD